jgi:DNA-binding MarR family transcriptional regulator
MLAEHGYGDFKTGCFGLLSNLDAEGNTVVELAERLFYTKQAVSKMVKDLEEAGYMHSIPHPVDKRAQLVRLTARGVELVSMATDQMNDFKQNFTKSLTHEEEEQLINLLGKLVEANMGALHPAHMLAVQTK